MPADGTVARAESGNRNGRQVTAFALRALDEEFLTGLHFKAAASTTKMSLLAAERKKGDGNGADGPMIDKRGGSPRVGGGASPKNTIGGYHRGKRSSPSRGGTPSFKPKINSMYQIMSMSAGARDNNSKFHKVRDKERSSSRSESVGRRGGGGHSTSSPNRASKSSRKQGGGANLRGNHHLDPVDDSNQRTATNLKGEGLMKTLTGSRAPAVSKGARSILKGNPAGGGGGSDDDDDAATSGGGRSPYGGASRRTSNASSVAASALNTQGGLFGATTRAKSAKSDVSRASSFESGDRVQRGSSFGSSASANRTADRADEDDVVAVTVDSEGSSSSSGASRRKRRSSTTPSPRSPMGTSKRSLPRSNPAPTPAPLGSNRPVKLTEANIKAAQRRLNHQEASSKSRATKGHGGENALLQKIVQSGTALPQDSKINRMSSYASTAMSSGASSRGSIGRPQRRPYRSLEEYLCEPVAERLFGYDSRKMRHRIQQKQMKELENLAVAECTFSPKLDSKSMTINTQSQSSLMKNARFRRQIMRSPPRSSQTLRRSDSVMSAAWGNGSDFMSQVRPPSEYPESQMDTAGRRSLKLTPKARKIDRNVSDLFTWEVERAEKLKDQQDKARRLQEDAALREEMEVYALREKRQESGLHRSGSNLSASGKSRRSKSSRRVDGDEDVLSSSMRGGSSLTPSALRSRNNHQNNRPTTPKRISLMSPQSKKIIKRLGSDRITVQEYAEVESKMRTDRIQQTRDEAKNSREAWSVAEKLRQEKEQLLARQQKENERVHRQAARAALAQNSLTVDENYRNAEAMLTLKKFSSGGGGNVESNTTSSAQQVLSKTGSQSLLSGGVVVPAAGSSRGGGWGDSTASYNLQLRKVDSFVGSRPSSPKSAMKGSSTTHRGGFSFSPAEGTSAEADLKACRERLASIAEEKRHIAELRRKVETNPGFSWWWMRLEEEKQAYRQATTSSTAADENAEGISAAVGHLFSNSSHHNNNNNLETSAADDSFAGYHSGGDMAGAGSFYNNSSMYSSFPTISNLQQGSPYGSFAGNPSVMVPYGPQHLAPPGLTVHSPNASFAMGRTSSHRPVSFANSHMDASP